MQRAPRLALVVAVFLATLTGLASTAQVDGVEIAPYYEDPTESELAYYEAELACAEIEGLELTGRDVQASGQIRIRCDYRSPESGGNASYTTLWLKSDYGSSPNSACLDSGERSEDGTNISDVIKTDFDRAVRGEYRLSGSVEFEPALIAALEHSMAAASPLARECAQVPEVLDCPEVQGHELGFATEQPTAFAADTYEHRCRYDSSSPQISDSFSIAVLWATPRGVPAMLDRLCNEPGQEGVGFGIITEPGVAANATYWRSSPLEGPDVEVAEGAARELLDQAAVIASDCSGAESIPTQYEPFPDYLEASFSPALTSGPGTGGGLGGLPSASPGGSDGGFLAVALRIGSIVMLVLSLLGLFITFLLVRRETRIRERRDLLRIAITLGVAVISVLILGRDAPLWAILLAVGLGVTFGTWQGTNLLVRSTERGLVAKRNVVAIVAFTAGIVLMQVAGFLNRTGGVVIGVAVSFLSAAITAGLFLGRKPRMVEALGGVARSIVPAALVVSVLIGFGVAAGEAQTSTPAGTCGRAGLVLDLSDCVGYEHLLDIVSWDQAYVTGGLWWDEGKPLAPIELNRGLVTAPQATSREVSWATTDDGSRTLSYELSETYSFGLLASGQCCSVFYEGIGTKTNTPTEGDATVETFNVAGRLDDLHPLGTIPLSNDTFGVPFTGPLTLRGQAEDSCQREVAHRQEDNEPEAATYSRVVYNGEESTRFVQTASSLLIDCDLQGFTYERAFSLAPPVPSADDPARVIRADLSGNGGEVCPVRQEFFRYVWNAGQFDGIETQTLADLFLEPNAPQCDYGGLFDPPSFGDGSRGGTRHEIIYRLAIVNDPVAEAARLADDEDTFFFQSRLSSIPPHERCVLGDDGIPIQPSEGETCRYITLHTTESSVAFRGLQAGQPVPLSSLGGQIQIETDWDLSDGPNVTVRAHMPWGKYVYRCHHCWPGDPAITAFIDSLHQFGVDRGFGDPDAGKGDVEPAPEAEGDVEEPEVDENFTESTEFTPIEEEGLSEEEAALIGLVGLLGSIGLLGASLEGTGLTPGDIASAIRRGDLTGGVGKPPTLLDEDGDPLFVNDGSYPEAPVGHVWWSVDGEGRWVSQEEAEDLVATARASDAELEQSIAERIQQMGVDSRSDFETLIRTSRAQAAADRMAAAMAEEETAALQEGALDAWNAAFDSGEQELIDFVDRSETLTAEQIQAVFDAIHRRGSVDAALDAIPEVNVWREGFEGTLNDLADLAETAGRPDVAWVLRNPGTSARVGAAVATGGASEFIAVPIDITQRLDAAQDRSLAENGRMMTNSELFGELGWALGTEAVYEVGGRLVVGVAGRVLSSADEVAEAALRQTDEAAPAIRSGDEISESVSRETSEAVEAMGRSSDEVAVTIEQAGREGAEEAAQATTRQGTEVASESATREGSQEASEVAAREGVDEGAEAATREGVEESAEAAAREGVEEATEGVGRQADELQQVPPKGNEGIQGLETGARIPDEMVEQTGLPRNQLDELQDYSREHDLNLTGRATNPHSRAPLADGSAVGKPLEIKIKTGTDIDVLLGAHPNNRGVVTLFEPKMPDTTGMSDELVQALERRHAQRMAEWNKYGDTWSRGHRATEFGGVERTHRFIDGRIEVLYDGKWRSVGGDFDLVDMTRADGSPLSAAEFQSHVDALVERGLLQHGGEVRVMTDLMRNNPHPPGSSEWMDAARDAWDLRNSLENAQLGGNEVNIGINGVHGLHRAPDLDEFLPWRGGFEAPDGGLLTP